MIDFDGKCAVSNHGNLRDIYTLPETNSLPLQMDGWNTRSRWWFHFFCNFHPYLGMISILTNIFSTGLKPPTRILFSYWGGLFAGAMVVSGISNPLLKARFFLPRKWLAFFDGVYEYLPPRSFIIP